MTDAFAQTLHLRVGVSPWHGRLVLLVYAIAAAVVLTLALYRPWFWLLLPLVILAAILAWRRARLADATTTVLLHWHADDTWSWRTRDGRWHTGRRTQAFVFGTQLVILTLRSRTTRWRSARVLLFNDSVDPTSHRRLRARLAVAPAPDAVDA